jgi:hypothetical protein
MTSSKYTNPTGPGYLGIWTTHRWSVTICVGTLDQIEWQPGDQVYVIDDDHGIAVVDSEPDEYLDEVTVKRKGAAVAIGVPSNAMRELDGFEAGDDVRAYDRSAGGIRIVPADNDPMLVTDGGIAIKTESRTDDLGTRDANPVLFGLFIVTIGFHIHLDILVTGLAWHLESNPVVTQLGLRNWLFIKLILLIGLFGVFIVQPRTKHQPLLIASWLGVLIGLGIALILPNIFILLSGVIG